MKPVYRRITIRIRHKRNSNHFNFIYRHRLFLTKWHQYLNIFFYRNHTVFIFNILISVKSAQSFRPQNSKKKLEHIWRLQSERLLFATYIRDPTFISQFT